MGQTSPAFASSGGKHLSSIFGFHSLAEAMLFFAL